MGQYYIALILGEKGTKEFIRFAISSFAYACGSKLAEHSYIGNPFVEAVEYLISPNGIFYKSRLVWAGDYADKEPDSNENLHEISSNDENTEKFNRIHLHIPSETDRNTFQSFPYFVNHTKQLYLKKPNKKQDTYVINPLPILTAEGNGRGSGDYEGSHMDLVGTWARDILSMESEPPTNYTELVCNFEG